jgi:hypothetical protein
MPLPVVESNGGTIALAKSAENTSLAPSEVPTFTSSIWWLLTEPLAVAPTKMEPIPSRPYALSVPTDTPSRKKWANSQLGGGQITQPIVPLWASFAPLAWLKSP